MALVTMAGVSAGTSTVSGTTDNASRFGDIPSNIYIGAKRSVRRNADDTAFESYATDLQTVTVRVRSSDYPSGLTKGTVVYIGGATGNRPYVLKADADMESTSSKTFGILAENIAANGDGPCAVEGVLTGLDLKTSDGWADGDFLWLSTTAGLFTKTVPAEPAHSVFLGIISRAHPDLGTIIVKIQNGYELDELHGVLITTPANNDVLTYETSSGLWKNKPASGGGGVELLGSFYTDYEVNEDSAYIYTVTIPAGKLGTNGASLRAKYTGEMLIDQQGVVGGVLGSTPLNGFIVTTLGTSRWQLEIQIIRVTATSARVVSTFHSDGTSDFSAIDISDESAGFNWGSSVTMELSLEAVGGADFVTAKTGIVEFLPAP